VGITESLPQLFDHRNKNYRSLKRHSNFSLSVAGQFCGFRLDSAIKLVLDKTVCTIMSRALQKAAHSVPGALDVANDIDTQHLTPITDRHE
jgi:hypothetical protein